MTLDRLTTPYAAALAEQGGEASIRLNVPGHNAVVNSESELLGYVGETTLLRDFTPLLSGLDKGDDSPLRQAEQAAAEAWGARRVWFLTGGASQGNRIAAITLAAFREPETPVIVQRSAHSSFIDGIVLAGLRPRFLDPSIDTELGIAHGIAVGRLGASLAAGPAKGVYIISPSYFGAVADVAGLAAASHAAGVPLVVDAAWGAHFGFDASVPDQPLRSGADIVVSSTHKLGGSLTQSAMVMLGDGPFSDELEPLIDRAVAITQTTSANSLLLASLDIARYELQTKGWRIADAVRSADGLRSALRADPRFGVASDAFDRFDDIVGVDPMRVSIDVRRAGLNGNIVRERLQTESGIYVEIATHSCIVLMYGPGHTVDPDPILRELHRIGDDSPQQASGIPRMPPPSAPLVVRPRDAFFGASEVVAIGDAVGRVSADALAAYPPGIPNILPGERFTAEVVDFLRATAGAGGGYVRGALDPSMGTVRVLAGDI
jgi:arginine decarboxylase